MASHKRASMREGPLAALFRKTETEGLGGAEPAANAPMGAHPEPSPPPNEPDAGVTREPAAAPAERRTPSPQERLRAAFSSDIPDDLMASPAQRPADPYAR